VQVRDAKGNRVDEFSGLLDRETFGLVTTGGAAFDPQHLRFVKDGTLLFILPAPARPITVEAYPAGEPPLPAVPGIFPTPPPPVNP
jgi:hypothetical protein